jgi:hypothetical protein
MGRVRGLCNARKDVMARSGGPVGIWKRSAASMFEAHSHGGGLHDGLALLESASGQRQSSTPFIGTT